MDADDERGWLVPHAFCCAITQEAMVDPVMAGDGHCYERAQDGNTDRQHRKWRRERAVHA